MLKAIADRLEFRGTDDRHIELSQAHFPRLPLGDARRVLALGCGTGVEVRALISHVDDPRRVLSEVRRIVRPSGMVAIFDGDYASMTFAHPDHALAKSVEEQLIRLVVANPRIMRDLPRLLREAELEIVEATGRIYANIGNGRFWESAAQTYGALLARTDLLPAADVDDWRAFQASSAANGTFFGASNYYTYRARPTR